MFEVFTVGVMDCAGANINISQGRFGQSEFSIEFSNDLSCDEWEYHNIHIYTFKWNNNSSFSCPTLLHYLSVEAKYISPIRKISFIPFKHFRKLNRNLSIFIRIQHRMVFINQRERNKNYSNISCSSSLR